MHKMTQEMKEILVKVESAKLPWWIEEQLPDVDIGLDLGFGDSISLRLEGKELKKILLNKVADEGMKSLKNSDKFSKQICLKGCDCAKHIC